MNNKLSALFLFIILILSACQQTSKIKPKTNEVNTLLRNITIDALKNKDYTQVQRSINALILNDADAWKFASSAIVSLPKEAAYEVLENALKNNFVNTSDKQLLNIAKIYIAFKDTDKALSTVNDALQINKNNTDAHYFRARLLTVLKKYQQAESDFNFIIKKQPKNEKYNDQYASFLQETGKFAQAQKVLERIEPTPDNLFKRIIFALQNKNNTLAQSSYEQLIKLKPTTETANQVNFLKGEAAYWTNKYDDAIKYYQQVKGGKRFLDAREMLGGILYQQKKYDESIEILHQLQNAEEKYAIKAYATEAQILKQQGKNQQAIETLSLGISIIPNNSDLLYSRALIYAETGKIKKAEHDLQAIIDQDADNAEALNALGYTWADNDMKLDKAYEYISKAIRLDPENAAILDSLGWVQFKRGEYAEAEKTFNKAIAKDTNDPELYIHQYKTQFKLNKIEEAKSTLNKAIKRFPDNKKLKELLKSL